MPSEPGAVTTLLTRIRQGSAGATDELVVLLYDSFRRRAHHRLRSHERPGHSFATSDLTHEAVVRLLMSGEFAKAANEHQVHRAFARAMRQALIDHARRRACEKRGGDRRREELDDLMDQLQQTSRFDALELDEALVALAAEDEIVGEVLQMKFFGGYEMGEIARALGVSVSTAERHARYGLRWLRVALEPEAIRDT